ncbi:MAG TPA: response regulator transcription factor [Firmicutes bacterium]|nr:response regulator transcription factor [Bacillota bacterium]
MKGTKVLVVDDEPSIVELIRFNLEREGFEVITAYHGNHLLDRIRAERPDLIILDIMLPGEDGLSICREVRKESSIPIIMLTAKDTELDKVLGLELGADDYVTKPFSPRELVARVRAVLRRASGAESGEGKTRVLKTGGLVLDPEKHSVTLDGRELDLPPKEFELLRILMENRGRVLTRDYLLETIWGYEYIGDTRTVDVHIRRLRQKIEDSPSQPRYIETVHGFGYKMKEERDNG